MMFREINLAELPYDDGSGYRAEIKIDQGMVLSIKQGNDRVVLGAGEWKVVRDAIDKAYGAVGHLLASPQTNGEQS